MQEIIADFASLGHREDFPGRSIPLGTDSSRPELSSLTEGQPVILVEPGDLRAEGYITIRTLNGERYFYGIVTGQIEEDTAQGAA